MTYYDGIDLDMTDPANDDLMEVLGVNNHHNATTNEEGDPEERPILRQLQPGCVRLLKEMVRHAVEWRTLDARTVRNQGRLLQAFGRGWAASHPRLQRRMARGLPAYDDGGPALRHREGERPVLGGVRPGRGACERRGDPPRAAERLPDVREHREGPAVAPGGPRPLVVHPGRRRSPEFVVRGAVFLDRPPLAIPRYTRLTIDDDAPATWRATVWVSNNHEEASPDASSVHVSGPWNAEWTFGSGASLWFDTNEDHTQGVSLVGRALSPSVPCPGCLAANASGDWPIPRTWVPTVPPGGAFCSSAPETCHHTPHSSLTSP